MMKYHPDSIEAKRWKIEGAASGTGEMTEETGSTAARERCIRQPVLSAERNAKFLSSPQKAGLSIAGIATPREGNTKPAYSRI